MSHVVIAQAAAVVPVAGGAGAFPVHRIYCVGRNYAEHAREMGADPQREPPFFSPSPPMHSWPMAPTSRAMRRSPACTVMPSAMISRGATCRRWPAARDSQRRQQSDLDQMIWNVAEIVAELSTLFTLRPGDLIYTGTPAGVGALQRGDRVEGGIDGLDTLRNRIV
jgi:2-keto-4-pentenoate hydratase/2-oxohepta-3-ene-1,7-dioic acid hydratase in catechol pathway